MADQRIALVILDKENPMVLINADIVQQAANVLRALVNQGHPHRDGGTPDLEPLNRSLAAADHVSSELLTILRGGHSG